MLMSNFFINDTATTEIYTLALHDALPISLHARGVDHPWVVKATGWMWSQLDDIGKPDAYEMRGLLAFLQHVPDRARAERALDRKSTRLNSSHANISYAVFCLKQQQPTS